MIEVQQVSVTFELQNIAYAQTVTPRFAFNTRTSECFVIYLNLCVIIKVNYLDNWLVCAHSEKIMRMRI